MATPAKVSRLVNVPVCRPAIDGMGRPAGIASWPLVQESIATMSAIAANAVSALEAIDGPLLLGFEEVTSEAVQGRSSSLRPENEKVDGISIVKKDLDPEWITGVVDDCDRGVLVRAH